ncbi:helix-turn-helix domain-containing protein [Streptomyces griseoviridis]|uniref:helix-turn-helix domain-containing protein n=1 Tax=Streptomyces griseoviridis TaxID=45398 RepID=UPI003416AD0D
MPSHPRRRDARAPLPGPAERARLRRAWHLTEQQVAEAFGVTATTVRSWETGRTTPTGVRRAGYAAFLSGLAQGLLAAGAGAGGGGGGADDRERNRAASGTSGGAGASGAGAGGVAKVGGIRKAGDIGVGGTGASVEIGTGARVGVGRETGVLARQDSRPRAGAQGLGAAPLPEVRSAGGVRQVRRAPCAPLAVTASPAVTVEPVETVKPAPTVHRPAAVLRGRAPAPVGRSVTPGPDPVSSARRRRLRVTAAAVGVWTVVLHLMASAPPPHV